MKGWHPLNHRRTWNVGVRSVRVRSGRADTRHHYCPRCLPTLTITPNPPRARRRLETSLVCRLADLLSLANVASHSPYPSMPLNWPLANGLIFEVPCHGWHCSLPLLSLSLGLAPIISLGESLNLRPGCDLPDASITMHKAQPSRLFWHNCRNSNRRIIALVSGVAGTTFAL